MDVDKDTEDNGLEEGERNDSFSYEGGDDLICRGEIFLHEFGFTVRKIWVFCESI